MSVRTPRQTAWIELSELWLDTEHEPSTLEAIARKLQNLPFSVDEIDEIHWREVAPVLRTNLWPPNPAGVWTGFDPDWLIEQCQAQAARRHRWTSRARSVWLRRGGNWQYDIVRAYLVSRRYGDSEADLEDEG